MLYEESDIVKTSNPARKKCRLVAVLGLLHCYRGCCWKDTQNNAPLLPVAGTEFSGHTPVDGLGAIVTSTSVVEVGVKWMLRRRDFPRSHGSVASLNRSTGVTVVPVLSVTFILVPAGIVIVVHATGVGGCGGCGVAA
jgi:hypothetical protein